jgi:hypothetical protein
VRKAEPIRAPLTPGAAISSTTIPTTVRGQKSRGVFPCWLLAPSRSRCRPECGWNLVWRILREHESIVSGNKVDRLIYWFCGEGLPTIDLAHVDLS